MIGKRNSILFCVFMAGFVFGSACFSDTFTNHQTKEVLHGYATSQTEAGKTVVQTQEKGEIKLNLSEWEITTDRLGRNNKVIVLMLDEAIILEIETTALEQAIKESSDEGPLFILLEIDTPGGRIDLAQRICGAITGASHCPVIAFINGGKYGGAISAGAAVALACDKIYMANNTVIGAATLRTSFGEQKSAKKNYGDVINEKMSSFWRAYLASLAEQNDRPGLLARAMVDNEIEVIEVTEAEKRFFIEPVNKNSNQHLVRTWSQKGSLLTLTTAEATSCGIVDEIVDTRDNLLQKLGASDANGLSPNGKNSVWEAPEIVINDAAQDARTELKRAEGQLKRIRKSVDFKIKESQVGQSLPKVLSILREAEREFEALIRLAKRYPDLHLDLVELENELNSIKAIHDKFKRESRRR